MNWFMNDAIHEPIRVSRASFCLSYSATLYELRLSYVFILMPFFQYSSLIFPSYNSDY